MTDRQPATVRPDVDAKVADVERTTILVQPHRSGIGFLPASRLFPDWPQAETVLGGIVKEINGWEAFIVKMLYGAPNTMLVVPRGIVLNAKHGDQLNVNYDSVFMKTCPARYVGTVIQLYVNVVSAYMSPRLNDFKGKMITRQTLDEVVGLQQAFEAEHVAQGFPSVKEGLAMAFGIHPAGRML